MGAADTVVRPDRSGGFGHLGGGLASTAFAKKENLMNSRLWKRIPILAVVALGSGLILAGAQGGAAQRRGQAGEAQLVEGTWRVHVSVFDCQTRQQNSAVSVRETVARGGHPTGTRRAI